MTIVLVRGNPETDAISGPLVDALGRADVVRLSPPGFYPLGIANGVLRDTSPSSAGASANLGDRGLGFGDVTVGPAIEQCLHQNARRGNAV